LNFYEARNDVFSSRLNRAVTLSGEIRERIERFKNSNYEIRTALYPSDLIFRGIPRNLKVENFIIVNNDVTYEVPIVG
jgi:hypothetical protein